MQVHIFAAANSKPVSMVELATLKPDDFVSTGNATKPETIAKQKLEAEQDWLTKILDHPFAHEVKALSLYVVVQCKSYTDALLFASSDVSSLMQSVSDYVRTFPLTEGEYYSCKWYGDNVDMLRKIIWAECAREGLLRSDAPYPVCSFLLYGCQNYELEKLLELKTNLVTSPAAAAKRILSPESKSFVSSYERSDGQSEQVSLKVRSLFAYSCFADAGAVPVTELASKELAKLFAKKGKAKVKSPAEAVS